MNLAIMCDYQAPKSGNFIPSLLTLARKVREDGGNVYFMFPQNNRTQYEWLPWLQENDFEVTLFDDTRDSGTIFAELEAYLRQRDIHLIHCHFGFCLNVLALNMHKLPGIKLLVHDHMDYNPDKNIPAQYVKQTLMSLLFRLQDISVVTVMEKKAQGYRLRGKNRVWFVPNGLSLERYVPRSLSREELRDRFSIGQDVPLILFLGWDMNRKGVDIAITATGILRKTHPQAQLALLGFGEHPTEEQCQWMHDRTGIDPMGTPWLRFLPGMEDMFACHRAADVYLSASRREAFSYGLLEAISQNVPVVVSDIEGTRWAQTYSKSLFYPVESAEECAQALAKAIAMRNDDSNQQVLLDQYGIDGWCNQLLDIYAQILG